jgi:hypothetical protein
MILLTRIEAALAAGRKPPELPDSSDSSRKLLRSWIHLVRGLLRENRGDTQKAKQSFEKAAAILPSTFIFAAATIRLEALSKDAATDMGASHDNVDAALRRKKKKRR